MEGVPDPDSDNSNVDADVSNKDGTDCPANNVPLISIHTEVTRKRQNPMSTDCKDETEKFLLFRSH